MSNIEDKSEVLILIVDDVPKNIQLLGKLLSNEGYKIAAVSNGNQVLKSAEKYRPDLILLDVMMPGKDGFEVCEELKAHPDLKGIPVIFLSAKAEQENIVDGLKLGGADYITKPFNSEELLVRVETHVSLKKSRDRIEQQNEELKRLNSAKDKIYSVIGHDLRGPIGGINSFVELIHYDLDEGASKEEIKEKLEILQQTSSNAWNLLHNLLSWARVQTGDMRLRLDEFDVSEKIHEVISLLSLSAERKGVELRFDYEDECEQYGDALVISTILRNLLSNAIKFSENGDTIEVLLEAGSDTWSISIEDEGKGMSPEVVGQLFDSEEHPSKYGTENEKGSGFGLLLCQKLATLHRGKIHVQSTVGEGSVFTLEVPIEVESLAVA